MFTALRTACGVPGSTFSLEIVTHNESVQKTISAWLRLERARNRFDTEARRHYGISGSHLALLRLIDKQGPISLLELRKVLGWQSATIGQAVKRLVRDDLITLTDDPADLRRRVCRITEEGGRFLLNVPMAGPARLRTYEVSEDELTAMRRGFEIALRAYGYEPWSDTN